MLVDWFTVAAQILNFLILVWLLKRFLYQPVLDAIDAREARIRAELDAAATTRSQAQAARHAYEQRNSELDARRGELLAAATADADEERRRLIEEARSRADALSRQRQAALEREAAQFGESLVRRTGEAVLALSADVLRDLADAPLQARIVDRFLQRLTDLDEQEVATFAAALAADDAGLAVRSGIELPEAQRALLRTNLTARFHGEVPIRFDTAPELLAGIELRAGGRALSWSVAGRLDEVRRGIEDLVHVAATRGTPSPARSPTAESAGPADPDATPGAATPTGTDAG